MAITVNLPSVGAVARLLPLIVRRSAGRAPQPDSGPMYLEADYIPTGTADLWRSSRPRIRR